MKFNKPKFWDYNKISFWAIVLFPISLVYLFIFWTLRVSQSHKYNRKNSFPLICVGNIYIGGTGKTPLVREIFEIVRSLGKNPAFIKKKYDYLFDEIKMLEKTGKTFVCDNRISGISEISESNYEGSWWWISRLYTKPDLSILCFNAKQLIGNGFVIPSGPLRENLVQFQS